MICIHFSGGALGHLVLKTIYRHWPDYFGQEYRTFRTVNHSNHDAVPALFLRREDRISHLESAVLEKLDKRSIILCHNAATIPITIRQKINFVNIICSAEDAIQTCFLYVYKSSHSIVNWCRYKQQSGYDFYETFFQELVRLCKIELKVSSGINLSYDSLKHYESVAPVIALVKNYLELKEPIHCRAWYMENYHHSVYPCIKHSDVYEKFREIFRAIQERSLAQCPFTYTQTVRCKEAFVDTVDFFSTLSDKYNTQMENNNAT